MNELQLTNIDSEVTISMNEPLLLQATQQERDSALTTLFIGLTKAITDYGCAVDISDPMNIKISRQNNV
jgi:hypothetical protein